MLLVAQGSVALSSDVDDDVRLASERTVTESEAEGAAVADEKEENAEGAAAKTTEEEDEISAVLTRCWPWRVWHGGSVRIALGGPAWLHQQTYSRVSAIDVQVACTGDALFLSVECENSLTTT